MCSQEYQNHFQSKALILFNYMKAQTDEETIKEKPEASRRWLMRFKESCIQTSKCKVNRQVIQKL